MQLSSLPNSWILATLFPNTSQPDHLFLLDIQELISLGVLEVNEELYLPSARAARWLQKTCYYLTSAPIPKSFLHVEKGLSLLEKDHGYTLNQLHGKFIKAYTSDNAYKKHILRLLSKEMDMVRYWDAYVFQVANVTAKGKSIQQEVWDMVAQLEMKYADLKQNPVLLTPYLEIYGNKINLINYLWLDAYVEWKPIFKKFNQLHNDKNLFHEGLSKFTNTMAYIGFGGIGYASFAAAGSGSIPSFDFGGGDFGGGGAVGNW